MGDPQIPTLPQPQTSSQLTPSLSTCVSQPANWGAREGGEVNVSSRVSGHVSNGELAHDSGNNCVTQLATCCAREGGVVNEASRASGHASSCALAHGSGPAQASSPTVARNGMAHVAIATGTVVGPPQRNPVAQALGSRHRVPQSERDQGLSPADSALASRPIRFSIPKARVAQLLVSPLVASGSQKRLRLGESTRSGTRGYQPYRGVGCPLRGSSQRGVRGHQRGSPAAPSQAGHQPRRGVRGPLLGSPVGQGGVRCHQRGSPSATCYQP